MLNLEITKTIDIGFIFSHHEKINYIHKIWRRDSLHIMGNLFQLANRVSFAFRAVAFQPYILVKMLSIFSAYNNSGNYAQGGLLKHFNEQSIWIPKKINHCSLDTSCADIWHLANGGSMNLGSVIWNKWKVILGVGRLKHKYNMITTWTMPESIIIWISDNSLFHSIAIFRC